MTVMRQWQIFGLDETGPSQLQERHKQALQSADYIIADARFHDMLIASGASVTPQDWPKPFSDLGADLAQRRDQAVVIFTTGDPLYYGAAVTIKRLFPDQDIAILPAVSGIAMAAAKMGWPVADVTTLSIHGRAVHKILPHIYPNAKWLVIPQNAASLHQLSTLLCANQCSAAMISALIALGREGQEEIITKTAADWQEASLDGMSDFYVMAVDLATSGRFAHYSASGTLPDEAFLSDGKLTKQDVRASALSKLQPHPHAILWDLGTGCGSIAIEWARSYESCHAYGVDSRKDRLATAKENALNLGTPNVTWHDGDICEVMADLPEPDAIFIGGGLSQDSLTKALDYCPVGGRLVIHAVTLESEALLLEAHRRNGGVLTRLTVHKAEPVGGYRGWRGLMPVTQWVYVKQAPHGG